MFFHPLAAQLPRARTGVIIARRKSELQGWKLVGEWCQGTGSKEPCFMFMQIIIRTIMQLNPHVPAAVVTVHNGSWNSLCINKRIAFLCHEKCFVQNGLSALKTKIMLYNK